MMAFTAIVGCATEPSLPAEQPGVAVPRNAGSCGFGEFSQCVVWSPDSKELFAVESMGQSAFGLIAIDPSTLAVRFIGAIEYPARLEIAAADPEAIYYSTSITGTSYGIHRYAFSNGNARQLAQASPSSEFSISRDGSRLAFHPAGSTRTADTIAVIDVATTDRVATRAAYDADIGEFSPDGANLIVTSGMTKWTAVWNMASGSFTEVKRPVTLSFGVLRAARWDGDVLRGLFVPLVASSSLKDVGFYSGDTLAYAPVPYPDLVAWVPSMESAFVTRAAGTCQSTADCGERHFELRYTSSTTTALLGSINAWFFTTFAPSPDGKWLAYKAIDRPLYLIER